MKEDDSEYKGKHVNDDVGYITKLFGELGTAVKRGAPQLDSMIKGILGANGAMGKLRATASGLWGIIAAHPFFTLIAAVVAATAVFDALTVSEDEARENLSNLKNEYNENESKLKSLNGELDTTKSRIDELLAKESLTFTEQEELANLQAQNEELERQKSILEGIQNIKQAETRKSFVQTMDKDVNNRKEYQGWGSEGPMFFSDQSKIDNSFLRYKANRDRIARLDKEYEDDQHNKWYKEERERIENANEEISNYLVEKSEDFSSAASGISYIDNPTSEDDKKVNAWLDYINDYNDRMNILIGGPNAKKHAFDRIINSPKFDEATEGLKKLGEQGEVTADSLKDPKYADFLNNLTDVGFVSDTSADSLALVALAFNELSDAATDAGEAAGTTMHDIKKTSKGTLDAISGISEIQKVLASQESGKSISIGTFTSEGVQEYASALEYVNGVYQLNTEKVNDLVKAKVKVQLATIGENKALAQSEYLKNAAQIDEYRSQLEAAEAANDGTADGIRKSIKALREQNDALRNECDQYNLMSSALNEATNAYNTWLNAKSANQTGDMFDGALAAIKQIDDVLNNEESDMFGRIGRTDYKAAVDFIVPDTVDAEDAEAVNTYLDSISDMFTFGKDGSRTGLNIDKFIQKSLEEKLINPDKSGKSYSIAAEKTMEDFAEKLNLSMPLVRAMFGELQEFGSKFSWADEASQTIGDLGVAAYESAEALKSVDQFKDMKIVMDVSGFDDSDKAIESLEHTIEDMQDMKLNLNPDIDQTQIQQVDDIIKYCVAQKQLLSEPAIMTVDVSQVTSEIAPALELLQEFWGAQNTLDMQVAVGSDTSAAEKQVDGLVTQIQSLSPKILAEIGLSDTSKDGITTYIAGLDAPAIVSFGVDSSLVDAFEATEHNADGKVHWTDDISKLSRSFSATGSVTWKSSNHPSPFSSVNGSAHVNGSALFRGNWRTRGGRYLMGELGREIVVDPNTGMWHTVGDNGAEFVNLPEGAIVFNHVQSESLLNNGTVAGRGAAYVSGSALVSGTIPGGIHRPHRPVNGGRPSHNYHNAAGGANNSITNSYDQDMSSVDWIEIAIDRIERVIGRLKKIAESAFKSLSTKASAAYDEIEMVAREIELQQSAYDKYISAAESVNLSAELKTLVRNGAIDISQYDKDTKELIDDYKAFYEKALSCADSVDDLNESLSELYKNNFDTIQGDFENKLALMEKSAEAYDKKISMVEELGYMQNANYYVDLRNAEQNKMATLQEELAALQKSFNEAMSSGTIEEGSDAWYDMKLSIEDTKLAISDAELEIIKYGNAIRDIEWEYFDHAQKRISEITSEADFLLGLLDGKDMYEKNGNLSDNGTATIGLRAEKYGVYMAQADKYAEEIKRINKDIANDPNNQKLIDRRNELLASQRDSILMAKSEKEAMVDLVRDGIQVELDAVKELIDAYNKSLDSAKDLYDYQKRIAEKTADISTLEKQLAAYQNDMSEESRAKIQKIQTELAAAKDDLKETEYNQYVSEQKKMLDTLYSEYEDILNARFDNLDETFEKLIDMVNKNFIDINEYLSKESANVGYSITEATQSIWASGGVANGVVSKYGSDIASKLTGVGLTVENIFSVLEGIARENGVSFGGMKSYASGGLVDYTGFAMVHGSKDNPEMVLDANDTKNFVMLKDALKSMSESSAFGSGAELSRQISKDATHTGRLSAVGSEAGGYHIGEINITIPIDHVDDYNDFVNQLRNDKQFEQMIQSVTIGRLAGKSKLDKNKYRW